MVLLEELILVEDTLPHRHAAHIYTYMNVHICIYAG